MTNFLKFFSLIILFLCTVNVLGEDLYKKTVMIDLDGVLDNYTKYTGEIPSVRKGAREFIVKLSKD